MQAHLCYWHMHEIERFFHLFPLDLHNPEISEVLYIPRKQGIFVIGIFAGNEEELSVEKRIYGKDFAYIRNISNFSRIVGTFLRRQIDME